MTERFWIVFLAVTTLAMTAGCIVDFGNNGSGETDCSDGVDNDGDGFADCLDQDCSANPVCEIEADCGDGVDNDGDGNTDCDDSDCEGGSECVEDCSNFQDDDGDGETDCDDSDCLNDPWCGPQPCNNNGTCTEGYEDCFWCPDCCVQCNPAEGQLHDYIINSMFVATTPAEAQNTGLDLDGDGEIDNKLGELVAMLPQELTSVANQDIQYNIDNGTFILLGRLAVDSFDHDDTVMVQVLPGDTDSNHDATPDNLTGDGHVLIGPEARRDLYLCGTMNAGTIDAGPGSMEVPVYLGGAMLYLQLEKARMKSVSQWPLTPTVWLIMDMGGGLTREIVEQRIFPFVALMLNQYTVADPGGETGQFVLGMIDAACSDGIEGCENVINGEGECMQWNPAEPNDPPLTVTEIKCNPMLAQAFAPDMDVDADGEPDLLSWGAAVSAIRVNIDN